MLFDGDAITSVTLKNPALVYQLEIIAMVTRHLSVNRYLWFAGKLGLDALLIVGFRPQKSGLLMCYFDAVWTLESGCLWSERVTAWK